MTEWILPALLLANLILNLVERDRWSKERARLVDAAVARTPGELVALRAAEAPRKRRVRDDDAPAHLPPPIGL